MTGLVRGEDLVSTEDAIKFTEGLLRVALEALPPELFQLSRVEIEAQRPPGEVDLLLQRNFWNEVHKAKKLGFDHIKNTSIYAGVCSAASFTKVMNSPIRLVYMLHHPVDDMDRMRNMLVTGLSKIENELLKMPINDKNAGHFLKAVELLLNRVHGPMVQRIEAKHAHIKMTQQQSPPETMKDVNARLDELRSKLIQSPQQQQIIPEQNQNTTDETAIEVHATNQSG